MYPYNTLELYNIQYSEKQGSDQQQEEQEECFGHWISEGVCMHWSGFSLTKGILRLMSTFVKPSWFFSSFFELGYILKMLNLKYLSTLKFSIALRHWSMYRLCVDNDVTSEAAYPDTDTWHHTSCIHNIDTYPVLARDRVPALTMWCYW